MLIPNHRINNSVLSGNGTFREEAGAGFQTMLSRLPRGMLLIASVSAGTPTERVAIFSREDSENAAARTEYEKICMYKGACVFYFPAEEVDVLCGESGARIVS